MTTENTREALLVLAGNVAANVPNARPYTRLARGIEASPAALFDAMCADGMARAVVWCPASGSYSALVDSCPYADQHVTHYEVIPPEPPHVHEWLVLAACSGFHMTVDLICNTGDCSEKRTVPNRLPLEIPS